VSGAPRETLPPFLLGHLLRRLAHAGAAHGPEWFVRRSPAVIGLASAVLVPKARRAVRANLRRVRGEASPARDAVDVARTFVTYAECLTEVLSNGSKNAELPRATIHGTNNVDEVFRSTRGVVLVTAHTAGWELVGPILGRDVGRELVIVTEAERDARAGAVQDGARKEGGVQVVHGGDSFASLSLLRALRRNAVVAIQVDRAPRGMKTRAVTLLDAPGVIPEGPLRLAAAAGAPLLPLFCARLGWRDYVIDVRPPIPIAQRPPDAELDAVAQRIADEMGVFLRRWPTQWFHFG